MSEVKNVPKLRFPDFEGCIPLTALEKVIEFQSGYAFKSSQMKIDKGKYQLIKMSNVYMNRLALDRNPSYWQELESKLCQFVLNKEDIVLTLTGTVGKRDFGYSISIPENNKFLLNQRLVRLRAQENKSVSHFILNLLRADRFLDYFFKSSKGGTGNQANVGTDDLKKYKAHIPVYSEQQKIADFLSSVDKKIEQLTEKHRLLTEYKKGVMQQIFSQQIRFKDDNGNDYPEWEVRTLGSISKRKTAKNKDESINQVLTNSASQGIVSQTDYFDKDIANQNNLGGYYIVDTNDFVYNPRISVSAPVGPIKRNHLGLGVMSPLYTVFEITEGSQTFFERYFDTNLWHRYMNQIANFGARHDRMNITTVDFYKMSLPFPCIEEQQKIASFLTEIDQKINQAWSTLEQTKAFKKGLLQKMFV